MTTEKYLSFTLRSLLFILLLILSTGEKIYTSKTETINTNIEVRIFIVIYLPIIIITQRITKVIKKHPRYVFA